MVCSQQVNWSKRGQVGALCLALSLVVCGGCRDRARQEPLGSAPAETSAPQPAATAPVTVAPLPARSAPAIKPPAATQPAARTQPAATLPASTYDSRPPYPVQLHVRSPADEQPGWLKIVELVDGDRPATASGTFPEKNRIVVDTGNVQQIRVHVGHLPLARKKRVVLQIDGQAMELSRQRDFTTLKRRPTGEWVVARETQ